MLNIFRYVKLLKKTSLISCRYFSINKSDLVESSRNIQDLLKTTEDDSSFSKGLYSSLNTIHSEYSSINLATSSKNIYEKTSSKFNSQFLQFENDRKSLTGNFDGNPTKQLFILLRYLRYVQIAFIYRFITFDINLALKETSNSILDLTKNQENLNDNSLPLTCELTFFVQYLSSHFPLSHVKSLLSSTLIVSYLSNYLFAILVDKSPLLLVNQLCFALHSIVKIPSDSTIDQWPCALLKYLYNERSCSLPIIEYLTLIQHNENQPSSSEMFSLLNSYLIEIGIHQDNLDKICQLLILISSCHYSHELFQRGVIEKIRVHLKKSKEKNHLSDIKLCSRLIYYLCLTDPTNRFDTRATIVELSRKLHKNIANEMTFPQWIVQAQHGMMLVNIYNYQLLFSTVQHKFFPLLFRDMGVYTKSIQRQLSDIHHALSLDRPALKTRLLNNQMLAYTNEITDQYRSSIRADQQTYQRFLLDLKQEIDNLYGKNSCQVIDTYQRYPLLLFDFLEVKLPNTKELNALGIDVKQRIAVLPIMNSMLIRQQRSNGSSTRVYSAHTTMRYRLIGNDNYTVLPIFQGEFLRAVRDGKFRSIFETNLALKSLPLQSDMKELD
ncbi:unnamed protein product [Adineta ricciae]|uniref:Uncharacterized protein n=1 Tax=Adineta ricciae TaxID=249248 RepID=A0A815Q2N2_ADIRI|nr:unnamed protein product [Adineta ricciae]